MTKYKVSFRFCDNWQFIVSICVYAWNERRAIYAAALELQKIVKDMEKFEFLTHEEIAQENNEDEE